MCGRFVQKSDLQKIAPLFKAAVVESEVLPSYNITPRQPVAVIMEKGQRKIVTMKWGLIPHWAKDETISNKLINARSETVDEKPSFRDSFKKRRCLIIADGFYEWQGAGLLKKPFFIYMKDEAPFGMAGLFDYWTNAKGEKEITCTIVTTEANEIMIPIHHRMPVILSPKYYDLWLSPDETDTAKIKALLKPLASNLLATRQVSLVVNNPRNNSPECILPMQ
jgi:putative SOS response-associated peptidase YedK